MPPAHGVADFLLRLRESPYVPADDARGVHQRREEREIGGARVQPEKVETNSLERAKCARTREFRAFRRAELAREPPSYATEA